MMRGKYLILFTLIYLFQLSNNIAQLNSFIVQIDKDYKLICINRIIDPFSRHSDTIWHVKSPTILNFSFDFPIKVSIQRNQITIPDDYDCFIKLLTDIQCSFEEYKSTFESIEKVKKWVLNNLNGRKGDWTSNWSKKDVLFIQNMLNNSNDNIISKVVSNENSITDREYKIIDKWLWSLKLTLYALDPSLSDKFLSNYDNKIDPVSDEWIASQVLPIMRFSTFKLLLSGKNNYQPIKEIRNHLKLKNTRFNVLHYASLLYNLKKYYAHVRFEESPFGNSGAIFLDTAFLTKSELPEVQFVLSLYRSPVVSVDLNFKAVDLEDRVITLSDTITSSTIVIEFWGTWCKPCLENMPEVELMSNTYRDKVQFISIAIDKREKWKRYFRTHKLKNITHLLAERGVGEFYSPSVSIFPTFLLINAEGQILKEPVHTLHELEKIIQSSGFELERLKKRNR